ncbi:tonB-system energizer ExbB, partial [Mesorhizobium sp. M2D.F.Ca.ET.223.01.1.1]
MSRHGSLAALVASVILAATGAVAQEQPADAAAVVGAPAAPAEAAQAAPAV